MITDTNKPLKLLKNEGIIARNPDTPLPMTRVRKLKSIKDASKLIAQTTAELQRGNISIERGKAIGYLAQSFILSLRQSFEEKKLDEILKTKFLLLEKNFINAFDKYVDLVNKKAGLDNDDLQKIGTDFQQAVKMDSVRWRKLVSETKEEIALSTTFKTKLLEENSPKEIKELIAFRLRLMPEHERMDFINEIIKENGWHHE